MNFREIFRQGSSEDRTEKLETRLNLIKANVDSAAIRIASLEEKLTENCREITRLRKDFHELTVLIDLWEHDNGEAEEPL